MKTIILFIVSAIVLTSCTTTEKTCMTCLAEARSGVTVDYFIECNEDRNFLKGYAEGKRLYYQEHGDTVVVHCVYDY